MTTLVIKESTLTEFFTDEQCYITELINQPQDNALSLARARVEPGIATKNHSLKGVTERYLIVQGNGIVKLGDLPPERVGPGDLVLIPPDTPQSITNIGDSDLIFYCICTPGFTEGCYTALE